MNKKRIWLVFPTALMPYVAIFVLSIIFFSAENSVANSIMKLLFQDNALLLIVTALAFYVIAFILLCVAFFASICGNWDALSLAKTAMIIKLIQIPAYIVIFILALCFMITVFTIPFAIVLFFLDCLMLIMTGLLNIAAVICAIRQRTLTFQKSFWIIILQFLFCADVVASVICYVRLKKQYRCKL